MATFDTAVVSEKIATMTEEEKLAKLALVLAREEHARQMAQRPEAKAANKASRDRQKAFVKALKESATPEQIAAAKAKLASGNGAPATPTAPTPSIAPLNV